MSPTQPCEPEPLVFPAGGRSGYEIRFSAEPLTHLRRGMLAARRVQPVVTHIARDQRLTARDLADLPDELIAAIDAGAIDCAAWLLSGPEPRTPVILPQSFRTLGGRKGRAALAGHPALPAGRVRREVIVEIFDIQRGTPQGRLVEVASLIAHTCKGVFVRIQPTREALEMVEGVRLQGLTFDVDDLVGRDADVAHALLRLRELTHGINAALIAQGLPEEGFADVARVAGFSHAALRLPPEPRAPQRYVA